METESYAAQRARWPSEGRIILAHFDADTIVVYRAYRAEIAAWSVANQRWTRLQPQPHELDRA